MKIVTVGEVKSMIDRHEDVVLVNVLGEETFESEHIPGSYNVRQSREDFVPAVERLAGRKDRAIVVYCASKSCQASPKAAIRLTKAGFTDVADFEGGMAAWKGAGYEVETGSSARAR